MEKFRFISTGCLPSLNTEAITTPSSSSSYQCPYCSKSFTKPSALKPHLFTHTGEKPYQCHITGCLRRFAVLSNLRRHLKIHNKARIASSDRMPRSRRQYPETSSITLADINQPQRTPSLLPRPAPSEPSPPTEIIDNFVSLPSEHQLSRRLHPIVLPQLPQTAFSASSPPALSTVTCSTPITLPPEGDNITITQTLLMLAVMDTMSQTHSHYSPLSPSSTSDQAGWPGTIIPSISPIGNFSPADRQGTQHEPALCYFTRAFD
ncbi:hypothetical protein BX666DRAFT_230812 [Dichotomocladium elegans]|nr:hypothetical protein BX666DRAFT_230812 [Dichotomocladium elegans]